MQELFPCVIPEEDDEGRIEAGEFYHAFDFDVPEVQEIDVGLTGSLSCPGLLHFIHNAAGDVLSISPLLDRAVSSLAAVARIISGPKHQ